MIMIQQNLPYCRFVTDDFGNLIDMTDHMRGYMAAVTFIWLNYHGEH